MKIIYFIITYSLFLTSCSTIRHQHPETVYVSSHPPGANVIIDGYDCGTTPQSVALQPKYAHEIVLEKAGYQPHFCVLEPKISKKKIGSNALLPVGFAAVGAGAGYVAAGCTTMGLSAILIPAFAVAGLAVGTVAGAVGTGVDLYSGDAKKLSTDKVHAHLVPNQ
ncbi:MAG: PEGA domain-containing protein [Candidatus Protochlamydia sp.]|nr:PEGA domain-containing protein [Candidatus Protochlamydia sp.]